MHETEKVSDVGQFGKRRSQRKVTFLGNLILYGDQMASPVPLHCLSSSMTLAWQELQSLQGWRAAVSLLLEALDFATPILQKLGGKASEAVSWLLSALIGRSLGLIFRGIRQSLGMRRKRATRSKSPRRGTDETDTAYGYT